MNAAYTIESLTFASSSGPRSGSALKSATLATQEVLPLASARCVQLGRRLTPIRRDLLEVLASAQRPLGAYAIAERLGTKQQRYVAPTIVYRGLKSLVDAGLVSWLESRNTYVIRAYPDCLNGCVFLMCNFCGWVEEIIDQDIATLLDNDARSAGFLTERRVIEIKGRCPTCQQADNHCESSRKDSRKKSRHGEDCR